MKKINKKPIYIPFGNSFESNFNDKKESFRNSLNKITDNTIQQLMKNKQKNKVIKAWGIVDLETENLWDIDFPKIYGHKKTYKILTENMAIIYGKNLQIIPVEIKYKIPKK